MTASETRGTAAAVPTVAYVLSLIAGVLIVLNGLLLIAAGATLGIALFDGGAAFGIVGVILGAGMVYAATRIDARPAEHVGWGAAIIIVSTVSLVLVGGGFILGFILGLVGGIMAIAWRP